MHLETESYLGVTVNPYNTALTSGGSSGGEGALMGMKGSCLGIGTDIGGSIRSVSGLPGPNLISSLPQRVEYTASNRLSGDSHTADVTRRCPLMAMKVGIRPRPRLNDRHTVQSWTIWPIG
jgi:hypothetical protein